MTSTGAEKKAAAAPRRARTNKAASISHAACEVFGRDGYSRASIDTIAAEAGCLHPHSVQPLPGREGGALPYGGAVELGTGAGRSTGPAETVSGHGPAAAPADLERDLLALARAWVGLMAEFRNHFSLVRHIYAEAGHVPAEVLDAWQEAGPRAVGRQFAVAMAALDAAELVDVRGDPAQAAAHFMTLTSTDVVHRSYWGVSPLPPEETDRITAVGVQVFLRAYGR